MSVPKANQKSYETYIGGEGLEKKLKVIDRTQLKWKYLQPLRDFAERMLGFRVKVGEYSVRKSDFQDFMKLYDVSSENMFSGIGRAQSKDIIMRIVEHIKGNENEAEVSNSLIKARASLLKVQVRSKLEDSELAHRASWGSRLQNQKLSLVEKAAFITSSKLYPKSSGTGLVDAGQGNRWRAARGLLLDMSSKEYSIIKEMIGTSELPLQETAFEQIEQARIKIRKPENQARLVADEIFGPRGSVEVSGNVTEASDLVDRIRYFYKHRGEFAVLLEKGVGSPELSNIAKLIRHMTDTEYAILAWMLQRSWPREEAWSSQNIQRLGNLRPSSLDPERQPPAWLSQIFHES